MKTKVLLLKGFNTCFAQVRQVRLQVQNPFSDSCRPTGTGTPGQRPCKQGSGLKK